MSDAPSIGQPHDAHVEAAFRVVGFTSEAVNYRHAPEGFAWLCAFNGVSPDRAPWQWRYASSANMREYIGRRAAR